jgi:tRNA threonylcarbamoyladenosine biosynthesis protein TsaE
MPDETATKRLAMAMADALPADTAGWSVLLQGELGAGKSTFARALIRQLGHEGPVPSPTYTLVEPYELPGGDIYHVDLYRINDEDEIQYLGWADWQDGLLLVEWPERAAALLEQSDLRILLEYRDGGRHATLSARSARGEALLARLELADEQA